VLGAWAFNRQRGVAVCHERLFEVADSAAGFSGLSQSVRNPRSSVPVTGTTIPATVPRRYSYAVHTNSLETWAEA